MVKRFIVSRLQHYVRRYFAIHPEVKLMVVVGSVGKTSTKHALRTLLEQKYRVRMHEGNFNSEISAPLAILGIDLPPNLTNPFQWLSVLRAAKKKANSPTDVDVVIQELGTDSPGDISAFGAYLSPDIAVVTAITPEHMEFFGTIDAVAKEELSVADFSKRVVVNHDDTPVEFLDIISSPFETYGLTEGAVYRLIPSSFDIETGYTGVVTTPTQPKGYEVATGVVGEHSLLSIIGAIAAVEGMSLSQDEIVNGLKAIQPVPGRMNALKGIHGSTVIDDSYNSSPAAVEAAMKTLYSLGNQDGQQRIAVLGDMRELGATSPSEHEAVGRLCDPDHLSWAVMVGPDMESHAAPVARQRGCNVHIAKNALEAGEFVQSIMEPGAVILVKGSQNTIYLEECVKQLIEPGQENALVRQSPTWMQKKNAYFSQLESSASPSE